ncbi:MAG TPA: hypothetical protein VKY92_03085 [Verrucomicrobiae bacterium]|nr:hypothetical protein [Verrucomicrobiae bacterium]
MKVSAQGSSYTQMLGLHDPNAAGVMAPPGGIGAANAYADRTYDNGYVKKDPGTGNPNSIDPNTTWNWGFNNSAQYNAGAQTLSFQKQGSPGYNTIQNGAPDGSGNYWAGGFQMVAGIPLTQPDAWTFDLTAGFQGVWGAKQTFNFSSYREDVRQITVTDTYDVSGIGAASFPANGFHGTYLGPFDNPPVVPSPVIPNLPASRSSTTSAPLSTSYNSIGFKVDQSFYQFSLGPKVGLMTQGVSVFLRPSVSLDIVDANVDRNETFTQSSAAGNALLGSWSDSAKRQKVFFGLGAVVGANLDLGKGYYAGLFGGYDWVSEKLKVAVGPNILLLDGSGWVAGLSLGKRF